MNNKFKKSKNILVIDLLYMGDLIFATPFFRQLRKNFLDSKIDFIVNSNFCDIMENNPYFNNIFAYNKNWSVKESWEFAKALKKKNYDLGINIHGNWRSVLLMHLIDADYNIGYGGDGKGLFLDKIIETASKQHMVKSYLQFLENMGLKRFDDDKLELKIDNRANQRMNNFLNNNLDDRYYNKRLIALNTGGTWPSKRWSKEKFAKLADEIKKNGDQIIFIGGPSDEERVKKIIELMESKDVINAAGKTTLKELAALVKKCDLVISNDSGPVHVSAAANIPTITIFGPSDDKMFRPYGYKHKVVKTNISCRPCGEHECPLEHHKCMEEIKVEDIMEMI